MRRPYRLRIMIILSMITFFLFVNGIYAAETTTKVYTLSESVTEAIGNNWTVKAKEEKIRESEYSKKQAKTSFYPTLSTSYGYTRLGEVTRSAPTSIGIFTIPGRDLNTQDNYRWTATITQPLFTGFALKSTYELAKLGIDISQVDLELERLSLALKVKEAYFSILKADKGVLVAESAIESLESHVKTAKNFYEVGLIPINDLLKAEVELANAQHNYTRAQNGSRLARISFNMLLSRPVDENVDVEDILTFHPLPVDFSSHFEKAIENRPEIKTIELRSQQIEQQLRLSKSKYYPQVSMTANYIKEGDKPDVDGDSFHDDSTWNASVALSWTLWNWGKTSYSVRQNVSMKRQLMQTRRTLEDSIKLELKRAILNLQETEKSIPTAEKAVEQAEENLRVSEERYKAQVTTSTEVLDAQTLLSQARTNYYNALYDHHLAKAALLRAIGEY